ncbi:MAG: protein translocase subunit SecF, partial [Pirellulales bacterium]|nr:protein translocase subunit SecF [Pirellulales bacterium]
ELAATGQPAPAEKPSPGEPPAAAPPDKSAAPAADRFADGTTAELVFTHPIGHDALADVIQEVMKENEAKWSADFELARPGFEEGDSAAYKDWTIKIKLSPEEAGRLFAAMEKKIDTTPFFPSASTIGGKVAGSTRVLAIYALLASVLVIIVYLWVRFQRIIYGLAAVVALVHDVLITLGLLALSYWLAPLLGFLLVDPFKIGLTELAAFLTIIGYSLNDTIVVFDRVREVRGKAPYLTMQMVNDSVNQTLSRTLLTGLTTIITIVILYIGGGKTIHGFSFVLLIGILVGTFSSVFVASPIVLWMSRSSSQQPTRERPTTPQTVS